MDESGLGRRAVLRLGAAGASALLTGSMAQAQGDGSVRILGVTVPRSLVEKAKAKVGPLNLVDAVREILALEKQADARGLPYSPLDAIKPPPLLPVEGSFYESAVPRLVSVIDRSEGRDPETAEKAGALLADVHAQQRVIPDALKEPAAPLSTARDFATLKGEYARLFDTAEIRPQNKDSVDWQAGMIRQSRTRYEGVGDPLGVPWYFIGAIHGLEASFNFMAHLHNGDYPLRQRTRQVPANRPSVWLPPSDWASSATDALKLLGFANQKDWSIERMLYRLEAYNGFGYRRQRVASPYLWSYSTHYETGKFVADGSWNPKAKSRQCGAAVVIKALANAGDITFT